MTDLPDYDADDRWADYESGPFCRKEGCWSLVDNLECRDGYCENHAHLADAPEEKAP